jgi:prophage regulatory protein
MLSLLKFSEVIAMTGLSRSTIYLLIQAGDFPKQVAVSQRKVGFISEEIEDWIRKRIQSSRQPTIDPSSDQVR